MVDLQFAARETSRAALACLLMPLLQACNTPRSLPAVNDDQTSRTSSTAAAPVAGTSAARGSTPDDPSRRPDLVLGVLHIRIPQRERPTVETIWNHLREDMLDAETRLRLQRNGFRVGIGHERLWEPVRLALDAAEGHRVTQSAPVRVPPGFPLTLELDAEPRDQTLFCLGFDGVLSGDLWPQSRNVIQISYTPEARDSRLLRFVATPQVHQDLEGWRWVRTESGLWQVPRKNRHAFAPAGFVLTLAPGEFVLIAPSDRADVSGLVGRAFLTSDGEETRYDSYLILQPAVPQIGPATRSDDANAAWRP